MLSVVDIQCLNMGASERYNAQTPFWGFKSACYGLEPRYQGFCKTPPEDSKVLPGKNPSYWASQNAVKDLNFHSHKIPLADEFRIVYRGTSQALGDWVRGHCNKMAKREQWPGTESCQGSKREMVMGLDTLSTIDAIRIKYNWLWGWEVEID